MSKEFKVEQDEILRELIIKKDVAPEAWSLVANNCKTVCIRLNDDGTALVRLHQVASIPPLHKFIKEKSTKQSFLDVQLGDWVQSIEPEHHFFGCFGYVDCVWSDLSFSVNFGSGSPCYFQDEFDEGPLLRFL